MQAADFLLGREGNPDAMRFAEKEAPFSSGNFPLTESQSEVWIQSQMSEQASCAYNESDTVSLKTKCAFIVYGKISKHFTIEFDIGFF